jgi:hypothetical protein
MHPKLGNLLLLSMPLRAIVQDVTHCALLLGGGFCGFDRSIRWGIKGRISGCSGRA